MTIQHTCQFCNCPVTLELDEAIVNNIEYWKSLAACNRCADFREQRRGLTDRLIRAAIEWVRLGNKEGATAEKIRNAVVVLTQKYAELICEFHKRHFQWEPDFAQQIMDHPTNTFRILNFYERTISRKGSVD